KGIRGILRIEEAVGQRGGALPREYVETTHLRDYRAIRIDDGNADALRGEGASCHRCRDLRLDQRVSIRLDQVGVDLGSQQVGAGKPDKRLRVEIAGTEIGSGRQRAGYRDDRDRSKRQKWFVTQPAPGHWERADSKIEVQSADPAIHVPKRNDL